MLAQPFLHAWNIVMDAESKPIGSDKPPKAKPRAKLIRFPSGVILPMTRFREIFSNIYSIMLVVRMHAHFRNPLPRKAITILCRMSDLAFQLHAAIEDEPLYPSAPKSS